MITKGELDPAQAASAAPIARLGTAEKIAASVLWLSSPGAGYVVGVALDGGYTAQRPTTQPPAPGPTFSETAALSPGFRFAQRGPAGRTDKSRVHRPFPPGISCASRRSRVISRRVTPFRHQSTASRSERPSSSVQRAAQPPGP
jgi:hypothetical protein